MTDPANILMDWTLDALKADEPDLGAAYRNRCFPHVEVYANWEDDCRTLEGVVEHWGYCGLREQWQLRATVLGYEFDSFDMRVESWQFRRFTDDGYGKWMDDLEGASDDVWTLYAHALDRHRVRLFDEWSDARKGDES